jgi:hypothetical protein
MRSAVIATVLFFSLAKAAVSADQLGTCVVPQDLQRSLDAKYRGMRVATLSDLESEDGKLFQRDHAGSCPGFTKVDFYGDSAPTLALVLIGSKQPKPTARLVVAHKVGGSWQTSVLDTVEGPTPVVWGEPPGRYRDVYGKQEIHASRPVIVLTGYESWSIGYGWTGSRVMKVWLRD